MSFLVLGAAGVVAGGAALSITDPLPPPKIRALVALENSTAHFDPYEMQLPKKNKTPQYTINSSPTPRPRR